MKKGETVEVKIVDMSSEGQGIGRYDGFVVFVPGAVAGDTVTAELTKVKKRYAFSKLTEIKEPSPSRNYDFDCPCLDERCGGCQYERLHYDAQLKLKEHQVREKLRRLSGLEDPAVMEIIGMQPEDNDGNGPFRYRNKAQFPVSTGGIITRKGGIVENLGEPAVGFYRAKSHEVVDCEDCYLQPMPAMAAADALRIFMDEDNITAWDPKWQKGLIRNLIVKTGFQSREVMVVIVINGNGIPNIDKLTGMLDEMIYETGFSLESVILSIKKSKGEVKKDKKGRVIMSGTPSDKTELLGDRNEVAAGKAVIRDSLGDLQFEISPASFYQVNPVQMKRLYDKVREYCFREYEYAGEGEKPVILDLYCGIGTIGLYCADMAEEIVGIEIVKEAVVDANRNAVINGITNARYICGKAEEILPAYISSEVCPGGSGNADQGDSRKIDPEIAGYIRRADIAIVDPPRAGCRPELLKAVTDAGVSRIVYISCDPATLARDIKILGESGYEFEEATPVDMFPWTSHVETIALLKRA